MEDIIEDVALMGAGFKDCAVETLKYLIKFENFSVEDPIIQNLIQHLSEKEKNMYMQLINENTDDEEYHKEFKNDTNECVHFDENHEFEDIIETHQSLSQSTHEKIIFTPLIDKDNLNCINELHKDMYFHDNLLSKLIIENPSIASTVETLAKLLDEDSEDYHRS